MKSIKTKIAKMNEMTWYDGNYLGNIEIKSDIKKK